MAASQPGLNVRFEVVHTIYDESHPGVAANFGVGGQENLRNRVSSILYFENQPDATYSNYFNASHYTYDVSGNVPKILQEDRGVVANPFKQIEYDFDLYSGKMNTVWYNRGMQDQFAHHYRYDANNRIISTETSNDGEIWDVDAQSFYYHHGPLARLELGEKRVQGVDYAYTLSGWIKAVNSGSLAGNRDLGSDGFASNNNTANQSFAKDAFGYNLFYAGSADYSPIRGNSSFLYNNNSGITSTPLYNGNISRMVVDLPEFPLATTANSSMVLSDFNYDVLNRIVASRSSVAEVADNAAAANTFNGISVLNDMSLATNYTYDANGNILTLNRNTLDGTLMDQLEYFYDPTQTDNKLLNITEGSSFSSPIHHDIDNTANSNSKYLYDEIGNLIHDEQEQIEEIKWTVSGKVKMITWKENIKPRIEYIYDAMGNRIQKRIYSAGNDRPPVVTRYLRDAQGNTMAVYTETYEGQDATQVMNELHLYGSSRLGLKKTNVSYVQNFVGDFVNDRFVNLNREWIPSFEYCPNLIDQDIMNPVMASRFSRTLGDKVYELSNHLGNVQVTITDGKYAADQQSFWMPTISSFTDYYPFGMEIAERTWSIGDYRFGFNGKENDDEVKGSGNSVDFGARMYDSRLGRFLSIDPRFCEFPWQTTYCFADNKPLMFQDIEGEGTGVPASCAWATQNPNAALSMLTPRQLEIATRGAADAMTNALSLGAYDYFGGDHTDEYSNLDDQIAYNIGRMVGDLAAMSAGLTAAEASVVAGELGLAESATGVGALVGIPQIAGAIVVGAVSSAAAVTATTDLAESSLALKTLYSKKADIAKKQQEQTRKGGGKNAQHKSQGAREAAKKQYEEYSKKYNELQKKPNKTPQDKKELEKCKSQRDHFKRKMDDTGENHSQGAKGSKK